MRGAADRTNAAPRRFFGGSCVALSVMPNLLASIGGLVNLSAAQTGNGPSTNVLERAGGFSGMAILQLTTAVGATPTCTYAIEGSIDGSTWFAVPYADSATPGTESVATFVITTAGTVRKYVRAGVPWRFLRVSYSANTNVTNTLDVAT